MQVASTYSHLNGEEYLLVHCPERWQEVKDVIGLVDAEACKTKVSEEKTMKGKLLYSPNDMNKKFKNGLEARGWEQRRNTFWVTDDEKLLRGYTGYLLNNKKRKSLRLAIHL